MKLLTVRPSPVPTNPATLRKGVPDELGAKAADAGSSRPLIIRRPLVIGPCGPQCHNTPSCRAEKWDACFRIRNSGEKFIAINQSLPRLRCLHVVHSLTDSAALNQQFAAEPIHV